MTNSQELQRALKTFYCAKSLPPARVESLVRARTQSLLLSRKWHVKRLMPITALAAACAVCLFAWVRQEQQRATERAVCAEVVMNYEKHSPMQILSPHYSDVQAALNRLHFSIMPANARILEEYRLVGGRYCSIQGVPAAQLPVKDIRSGKECTLYAVKAVGRLQDVTPTIDQMDGVRVEVWRQDNVLFALAEQTD